MLRQGFLTFYACRTNGCPFQDVPYQIRELLPLAIESKLSDLAALTDAARLGAKPIIAEAPRCASVQGCGAMRARDASTTVAEGLVDVPDDLL